MQPHELDAAAQRELYVRTLIPTWPGGQWVHLWTQDKNKRNYTRWYSGGPDQLLADLGQFASYNHCYIGMGFSPTAKDEHHRLLKDDASGFVGVWADIDLDIDGHHKKGGDHLPKTADEALTALAHLPAPTMVTFTGGGLHVYWLFDEPWIFVDEGERVLGQDLSVRWQDMIEHVLQQHGWELDGVHDLARILRVPGTNNIKTSPPVMATLLQVTDQRYTPGDLLDVLDANPIANAPTSGASGAQKKPTPVITISGLVVDPDAAPDIGAFNALMKIKRTREIYEMTREMPKDNSMSAYELALADAAARASWNDQAICNLLIMFRREHNLDPHARNAQYYARTIAKARQALLDESDRALLDNDSHSFETKVAALSRLLRVKVERIVKHLSEEPIYQLYTEYGVVVLGDVKNLINQGKLRDKIAASTGVYMPPFDPKKEWPNVAQWLLDICEEQAMDEATRKGRITSVMRDYLDENQPTPDKDTAFAQKSPWINPDGKACIFADDIRRYMNAADFSNPTSNDEVCLLLRIYGAEPTKENGYVMARGKRVRTSRSLWVLPYTPDMIEDDEHNSHPTSQVAVA